MLIRLLRPALGALGLTQIRHIGVVRRGSATDLTARVYQQMERDFGVLAPPVALHARAPDVLAAAWILLREILIVPGAASRASKEAVATAVSIANECAYCATIHNNALVMLPAVDAKTPARGDLDLGDAAAWVLRVEGPGAARKPPVPTTHDAELVAVAVLLHYLNRMVSVFLRDVPLPPGVPELALSPVLRVLGWSMRAAARREHVRGASLDLLPAAPLPADLSWAAGNETLAEAFGRACAAIGGAGGRSMPDGVRDLLLTSLADWRGESRGISRAWVEDLVCVLPDSERPVGRLALLVAFAAYQVDAAAIKRCRDAGADDTALIELCSWAAMAAARRMGSLIPLRRDWP